MELERGWVDRGDGEGGPGGEDIGEDIEEMGRRGNGGDL